MAIEDVDSERRIIESEMKRLHQYLAEIDRKHFKCSICAIQLELDYFCLPCTHRICDNCWFAQFDLRKCPVCSSDDIRAIPDDLGKSLLRRILRRTRCSTEQNTIFVSVECINAHEKTCTTCLNQIISDMREERVISNIEMKRLYSDFIFTKSYVDLADNAFDSGDLATAGRHVKRARQATRSESLEEEYGGVDEDDDDGGSEDDEDDDDGGSEDDEDDDGGSGTTIAIIEDVE
jgi:hypothetical protein